MVGRCAPTVSGPARRSLSLLAKLTFALVATALLLEFGIRGVMAFRVGPSVLLYGTNRGRELRYFDEQTAPAKHQVPEALAAMQRHQATPRSAWHADLHVEKYSKYRPNQYRVDFDHESGERFNVTINRHGFRGREFSSEKSAETTRVLTLGSSSTFGYFNRDHETYPVRLETLLNERCPARRFEVVNLGIPHLRIAQIRELFLEEGRLFSPDVVTFYEGVNDSLLAIPRHSRGWGAEVVDSLRGRLVTVALLDFLLDLRGRIISPAALEAASDDVAAEFLFHLDLLFEASRNVASHFVLISQQAKSSSIGRSQLRGIRYSAEAAQVRERLESGHELLGTEIAFLAHTRVMAESRRWAERRGVPFVDGIAALDDDRDVLLSLVHLSPRGNRLLADAIATKILDLTCSPAGLAQE